MGLSIFGSLAGFFNAFGWFAAVFALTLIFMVFRLLRRKAINDSLPVVTVNAVLVSKQVNNGFAILSDDTPSYDADFECEDGGRLSFTLSWLQYLSLTEGEAGKLSYRGSCFLGFK